MTERLLELRRVSRSVLAGLLLVVAAISGVQAQVPVKSFTAVDGANLQERLDSALKRAKSNAQQSRFWSAYGFDVRPGVAIDVQYVGDDGSNFSISGNGVSVGDVPVETRNLGVFVLRDSQSGDISRVDVFNLQREHEFSGYPVFWMGRSSNEESLTFLKSLARLNEKAAVAEPAVLALAVHDDRQVPAALIDLAKTATLHSVRSAAINWLGRSDEVPETVSFLSGLFKDTSADLDLRERAVVALGRFKDPALLGFLTASYATEEERRLKQSIMSAIAVNGDKRGAVRFLVGVASSDGDSGQKRNALVQLSRIATRRERGVSERNDAETDVQREAVLAISRRDKEQAIPLLISIARTHPKDEVRRQAMLSLGRIGDDRATAFFRDNLLK
jgi:HEAT repeat protein